MALKLVSDASQHSYLATARKSSTWKNPLSFLVHKSASSSLKTFSIRGEGESTEKRSSIDENVARPGKMQSTLDLLASPISSSGDRASGLPLTGRDRCEPLNLNDATRSDHGLLQSNHCPFISHELRSVGLPAVTQPVRGGSYATKAHGGTYTTLYGNMRGVDSSRRPMLTTSSAKFTRQTYQPIDPTIMPLESSLFHINCGLPVTPCAVATRKLPRPKLSLLIPA